MTSSIGILSRCPNFTLGNSEQEPFRVGYQCGPLLKLEGTKFAVPSDHLCHPKDFASRHEVRRLRFKAQSKPV